MSATTRDQNRIRRSARSAPAAAAATGRAGRPPAVVHLDLDGARHIFRLHGWRWSAASDPVWETGLPRALDLFAQAGIRATFFLIAEDLDDPVKAGLVRDIVGRGHDIASHSMTHVPLRGLPADRLEREVAGSRTRIHNELGVLPVGFRAPYFSIDAVALHAVAGAGYGYDTSMMPGRNVPGVEAVPERPDWVQDGLLELPLPAYRPLPFPFHPSYSHILGVRYFQWGVARFARANAPLVLLFHLIDFSDPLPAAMLKGVRQRIYTLSLAAGPQKLEACRRMLECTARRFMITDTASLIEAIDRQRKESV